MKKSIVMALIIMMFAGIFSGCTFDIGGEEISASEVLFGSTPYSESEEKTIKMSGQNILYIPGSKEDIRITRWEKEDIQVKLFKKIQSSNRNRLEEYISKIELVHSMNKNQIEVFVRFGEFPWVLVSQFARLEIMIPSKITVLNITASSGTIDISDIEGAEKISLECTSGQIFSRNVSAKKYFMRTTSGDIFVKDIKGEGEVVSTTGRVSIDSAKGNMRMETTAGSIEIDKFEGSMKADMDTGVMKVKNAAISGENVIKATSGNIAFAVKTMDKDSEMNFSTTAGNIDLSLPKDASFDLSASTASGKVKTDFDINNEEFSLMKFFQDIFSRKEAIGEVNGGGAEINAKSVTGLIKIKKSP